MIQRRNQKRLQQSAHRRRRRLAGAIRQEPGASMQVLAREDLREIVRRLALGDRPGIAIEPLSSNR